MARRKEEMVGRKEGWRREGKDRGKEDKESGEESRRMSWKKGKRRERYKKSDCSLMDE